MKSKTTLRGVYTRKNGYEVTYCDSGKQLYLGKFSDYFEACCIRKSAEVKFNATRQHLCLPKGICAIVGCGRPELTAGLCRTHYDRSRIGESTEAPIKVLSGLSKKERYTHTSWRSMLQRCDPNSKHSNKRNYSEKGIGVCPDWMSFDEFFKDMGRRPPGFTLDRLNPDKGYSKENCRWASAVEQARQNRRRKRARIHVGVREKRPNRFEVSISDKYIGTYPTVEEAIDARRKAEQDLNYRLVG